MAAALCQAQRVQVYSEFQRVRPDGEVVNADRVESRRELISPAVARNVHVTYRVTVEAPVGTPYTIHIGQNPENTVKAALYQEEYEETGGEWVPYKVHEVALPCGAQLNEGQRVQGYLLDLLIPADAPVRRFRLEVQVYADGRWVVYPLELRIQEPVAPGAAKARGPLPVWKERADAGVLAQVCAFTKKSAAAGEELKLETVGAFTRRNVAQDLALAGTQAELGVMDALLRAGGFESSAELCTGGLSKKGAEWWLKFRDAVYQGLTAGR